MPCTVYLVFTTKTVLNNHYNDISLIIQIKRKKWLTVIDRVLASDRYLLSTQVLFEGIVPVRH